MFEIKMPTGIFKYKMYNVLMARFLKKINV